MPCAPIIAEAQQGHQNREFQRNAHRVGGKRLHPKLRCATRPRPLVRPRWPVWGVKAEAAVAVLQRQSLEPRKLLLITVGRYLRRVPRGSIVMS